MSELITNPRSSSLTGRITDRLTAGFIDLAERGFLPDSVLRAGMRKLCRDRLTSLKRTTATEEKAEIKNYVDSLKGSPLAIHTREANTQHYEVPTEFYKRSLGKNLKYSSCFYPAPDATLDQAEDEALRVTCERAELANGQKILELGCGWGSLTLTMGRRYPGSQITAISNSKTQRAWIMERAKQLGLSNIQVITHDLSQNIDLAEAPFDRVVSVEMFEHFKNYQLLLSRVAGWLKPDGKCFVHVFAHKTYAYPFETDGEDNWMGRYFFTGGQMPSHDLFGHFSDDLIREKNWWWDGTHYARTADDWLENQDAHRNEILQSFEKTYGQADAVRWFNRWRMFFMACSELFGYDRGSEWGVSHTLFSKKAQS